MRREDGVDSWKEGSARGGPGSFHLRSETLTYKATRKDKTTNVEIRRVEDASSCTPNRVAGENLLKIRL
jgi:hypothetical protein